MKSFTIKNTLLLSCILLICCMFFACNAKEHAEENHEDEGKEEVHADQLLLNSAQIKALEIAFGSIEQKNLTEVIKANGTLEVPPQNQAQINVLFGGVVRSILVMEGSAVVKGQILAWIENQEMLKLQQDYLEVLANFKFVEAEYKRQLTLKSAGAGTGKFFEQASASFFAEQSKILALESQLSQMGIAAAQVKNGKLSTQSPVLAPIKGTIGTVHAKTGTFAQPGTSLMEMVDNTKIHADLLVFEKDLNKIKIGQEVHFLLTNQSNREIKGKIYGVNKSFENESKGVIAHAIIEKPGSDLIPGMYVTGLISVGKKTSPSVPEDAVVSANGKSYIYLVVDQLIKEAEQGNSMAFEAVEVVTGVRELGYVQITPLRDLPLNSKIVVKGAFYLQSKSAGSVDAH